MPRIRWLAMAAAAGSLSAGVAVGATHSSTTTPVTATFNAAPVSQKERSCGATHTAIRVTFSGTQTSGDPRLTGALLIKATSVIDTATGYGYSTGSAKVSDPATGRLRFRGTFAAVLDPDGGAEGMLTGSTAGPHRARLLANFNSVQDASGALAGELGRDHQTDAIQDAAVLTDACPGGHHDQGEGHRR